MLNSKRLKIITYVALFLLAFTLCLPAQPTAPPQQKIPELINKLGAEKFRERKQAVKDLIKLGFYARAAIQEALNADDPEVRANALEVWNEIKNIITPYNSKEVSIFIEKLQNFQANRGDWLGLMRQLKDNSLAVMIQLFEKMPESQKVSNNKNDFTFGKVNFIEGLLVFFEQKQLQDMAQNLNISDKKSFAQVINDHIEKLNSFEQATICKILEKTIQPVESLPLLHLIDNMSPYVLSNIPDIWLKYYKETIHELSDEMKFTVFHFLIYNEKLSEAEIESFVSKEPLLKANDEILSTLFYFHSSSIDKKHWLKVFQNSEISWHKLAELKLTNKLVFKEIEKLAFKDISKRSQMLKLVDRFFYFRDVRAIPLLDKIKGLKLDKPSDLYNENLILLDYFSRIGDYERAKDYLLLYNKTEGRKNDTNFDFFSEQDELIKEDVKAILFKLVTEENSTEEKLKLIKNAIKISPKIATLYIQKAEKEIELGKANEAKTSIQKAATLLPDNTLEIRTLIHLSFDINAKELAEEQIKRLTLEEENINNCILAAGAYEFFDNRDKAEKYQKMIYMTAFGTVRNLFYDREYQKIPEKCFKPEEGDFQYLWGIMAKFLLVGATEAKLFMNEYTFADKWPKSIAFMLIGKISPDELIAECHSHLSVSEQRGRLTESYFYIGCKYIQKDPELAKKYFQKSLDLKFREYYEYISSAAMIKAIK